MGLFKRLFAPKPGTEAYRREFAEKLNGSHLKYVTERKHDDDYVIGREGALILKNDELLVYSSAEVVMRVKVAELDAAELMNLEGVILTGPDLENNGEVRTVIAYYTYYRKVD